VTQPPNITDEQLRDAFLAGQHTPRTRPDQAARFVEMNKDPGYQRRYPTDRPLSAKWYMIMTMQLRGLTNREISAKLSITETTLSNITRTERYRLVLKSRMESLDSDIIALKPKAIDALAGALVDTNRDTALRAARTYFEMTGQGTFGKQADSGLSSSSVGAVSLAKALVAEARAEVHIHLEDSRARATEREHELVDITPSEE
jgi:hypothetical protein